MQKIDFRHGGPEYDAKYPDGIPTTRRDRACHVWASSPAAW